MTRVRIYQPSKTPMQSGMRKANHWVLTFEKISPELPSPPMGWLSSQDMTQTLRLSFPSLVKAIEYAKQRGWSYHVCTSPALPLRPKAYKNNFTCARIRNEAASCNLLFS